MLESKGNSAGLDAGRRDARRSVGLTALRLSYPLRHLTSDAITGQALGGLGGTVAGAGTGAALMGVTSMLFSRSRRFRAASISFGAVVGGTLGSSLGGVSGAVTGLFVGVARLPFSIARSMMATETRQLITPVEKTARAGWKILNNPASIQDHIKKTFNLK